MSAHADTLRLALGRELLTARQLVDRLGLSQPTVSRALSALGDDIVRIACGRSVRYALRDAGRGVGDIPVYRVRADGTLRRLGTLLAVRPHGFVMRQEDGETLHSDGLPWWLCDMRPQGFLGRAYAQHHADRLGLPARLNEWSDSHVLRALVAHGHDVVGNILLGDTARELFIEAPAPTVVDESRYPDLAAAAERGDVSGSSAGGEQPKFVAYAGSHVLVKFSAAAGNPVAARWRDLLAAEHLAAEVLRDAGIEAVVSRVLDRDGRRFLEVERFDRVGERGRRALHSLTAVEAEFVGGANAPWPVLTNRLAEQGVITPEAAAGAALLYAFGTLIGNTDMHNGNLSFVAEHGRPYALAPAYDMLPMALSPRSGGVLPDYVPPARLIPEVPADVWQQACVLADAWIAAMRMDERFSDDWRMHCVPALARHLGEARAKIARLA